MVAIPEQSAAGAWEENILANVGNRGHLPIHAEPTEKPLNSHRLMVEWCSVWRL